MSLPLFVLFFGLILPVISAVVSSICRRPAVKGCAGASIEVFILDVVFVLFVDRVVRQMHEQVLFVSTKRALVRGRGETGEAIVEKVNTERLDPEQQHIKSEIELELVD